MGNDTISRGSYAWPSRPLHVFSALVLLSLLAGCGPKLQVGYEDPSFRSPATFQRPVAVGGFVWSADPVERQPEVNAALEATLWKRLSEDVGPDRIKNAKWVSETLDSADRAHILKSLEASGRVDSLGCDRLRSAFSDSSALIVFGCLIEDKIDTTTNYPTTADGKVTNAITRTVRIILEVYDPVLGRDVWRAEISNKDVDTEEVGGGLGLGETLALFGAAVLYQAIFGEDEEPPPAGFRILAGSPRDRLGHRWRTRQGTGRQEIVLVRSVTLVRRRECERSTSARGATQ